MMQLLLFSVGNESVELYRDDVRWRRLDAAEVAGRCPECRVPIGFQTDLRTETKTLLPANSNASITHYFCFETHPMTTSTSKLTTKYQATIPAPVRKILHVEAGDAIAFDIRGDEVRVRKARPVDHEFARALEGTLVEWSSAADEEAYRDL